MKFDKKNFFLYLNKNFLFENNPVIAVAVSGGPDSMALIYLMKEWIKSKKGKIVALLIDHKLRVESYSECKKTKNYLKTLNVNSNIIRVSAKKIYKKNMYEARQNRYDKLIGFCKNQNILHLFLGHHFDDNLETFLIRKVAGSNFEGLASMPFSIIRNKVQLIRPLLNYKKNQIIKFNKANKIKFIDDPSNFNEKYTRVVIRNFLIQTNHKNIIKKDFKIITSYIPLYKKMINETLQQILIIIKKNNVVVSFKNFKKLDEVIKEKIIEKIFYYFQTKNKKSRYSKIKIFLSELNKNNLKSINISNIIVVKSQNSLDFSINK